MRRQVLRSIPTTVVIALAGLVMDVVFQCFSFVSAALQFAQRSHAPIAYVLLGAAFIVSLVAPLLGLWAIFTRRWWAPIVVTIVALWALVGAFVPSSSGLSIVIAVVEVGATVAAWLPITRRWLAARTPSHRDGTA
jgi:hypothetical protein